MLTLQVLHTMTATDEAQLESDANKTATGNSLLIFQQGQCVFTSLDNIQGHSKAASNYGITKLEQQVWFAIFDILKFWWITRPHRIYKKEIQIQ